MSDARAPEIAKAFAKLRRMTRHPKVAALASSFIRLQALSEVPALESSAQRRALLGELGVSWHSQGEELIVDVRGQRRVVSNVGVKLPAVISLAQESPDGSSSLAISSHSDEWEEWLAAESYAEEAIVSIEASEYEAESILEDLYWMEAHAQALCGTPDAAAAASGPCIDAIYLAIMEVVAGIGYYATNKGAITSALSSARQQVQLVTAMFSGGAIGVIAFGEALVTAAGALIAAVSPPWWAVIGVTATLGYIAYQASECFALYYD